MTYILKHDESGKMTLLRDGRQVEANDILTIYPEKRVYRLEGKMGAGKTTFTKMLCESMGSKDIVNSPTFAIVNVYEDAQGDDIYHFDCYRLQTLHEALDLGAEEYLYSGRYCFVEWAENIEELMPQDTVTIKIDVLDNDTRQLTITEDGQK